MKVLIVDDEQAVVTGIKMIYDWEKNGFKVFTALNGSDAVQIIDKEDPDLVITDIRMPRMDGMELCEYIFNEKKHIEVILLSGHGEFEYAKKAIALGVKEYLLKPIQPELFEKTINKAKERILNRLKSKIAYEDMQSRIQQLMPEAKNNFFNKLIASPERYMNDLEKQFAKYQIKLKTPPYYLIKIDLDMDYLVEDTIEMNNTFLKTVLVQELVVDRTTEIFSQENNILLCVENKDELEDLFFSKIRKSLQSLNETCKRILGFTFSAAISNRHDSFNEMDIANRECDYAFKNRFIYGGASQLCCFKMSEEACKRKHNKNYYSLVDSITINLKLHKVDRAEPLIDELFLQMTLMEDLTIEHYYGVAYSIIGELYNISDKLSGNERLKDYSYAYIKKYRTCESLKAYVKECVRNGIKMTIMEKDVVKKGTISTVLDYIQRNYNKNLTLANVANKVYLSPNYLCNLFKKELGINFNTYLTQVRVQRAKEMLKETHYTTQFIAEEIGYSDYTYFSQLFKKQTGMTPTEYKNSKID